MHSSMIKLLLMRVFSFQGSNLDSNAKMWRLVADLMNDLGIDLFIFLIQEILAIKYLWYLVKVALTTALFNCCRNADGSCFSIVSFGICIHCLHRELVKIFQ